MKLRTSFLKRCFALVMALALLVSATNLGLVLRVSADEAVKTNFTSGDLVADNYELTDAEKDLLKSGLLAVKKYEYATPADSDNLVTADEGVIHASDYGAWKPVKADIVKNGAVVQTVAISGGYGEYDTSVGNAFSVRVTYQLDETVTTDAQTTLLKTAGWLKAGVDNLDAISDQGGNMYILEQAMPELVNLADNGIPNNVGANTSLVPELKEAIYALNAQMTANGGKINMSIMVDEYDDYDTKTGYLMTNGEAMLTELEDLLNHLQVIATSLNKLIELDDFLDYLDDATRSQLETLSGCCSNLYNGLNSTAAADWTAANNTELLAEGVNYALLDTKVKALTELTDVDALTIYETLKAAEATVQLNKSMFNVTICATLMVVEDVADSAVLEEAQSVTTVVTLAEGASKAEIQAEVDAFVAETVLTWGAEFSAEHYVAAAVVLPETLTEDLTVEVVYNPVDYTITSNYAEDLVVPYGYQYTLPVHEDPAQAYDYKVNGTSYAQGAIYKVIGNTEITRTAGKAYTAGDLYTIIANCYGNDIAKAILQSGALYGNEAVNVRKPDPADAASLLRLQDGTLYADDYDAAYNGLAWAPYTYGAAGTENLFGGANEAAWAADVAKVQYILNLTNYETYEVQAILDLAATLKAEADEQVKTLDRLAAYHATMGQLDKTKLGALNGVIDVTDFTPGDGTDTDAKNQELRAYFKAQVSGIIAENLDANNYLKIYNILGAYLDENNGGLRYYYNNSAAVIAEIDSLSARLSALLADDEKVAALEIMVGAAGYPEYADKIKDLEGIMASVKAALTPPNAAIDLTSPNLGKLVAALETEGAAAATGAVSYAYLISDTLTVQDSSLRMVQVIIETSKGTKTVVLEGLEVGHVLTAGEIADLQNKMAEAAAELLGENVVWYDAVAEGTTLESLVGAAVEDDINVYYTYVVKEFVVHIEGEADQIVTIEDLEIELPVHPTQGWTYAYTIGTKTVGAGVYTFTTEELKTLFVDGELTITRTASNDAEDKFEDAFGGENWEIVKDGEGNIVGLIANIDANKDGAMGFVMDLMNAGYDYIGLNGEALMYLNAENTTEVSLQTLINAILKDNTFGSETLIALGENGSGKLVKASLQLGNNGQIVYTDLDFTLNLSTVPSQMATVAKGLKTIKPYMSFQSQDGVMTVDLNLPEKVYEVYLTALLATGNVDKNDINAINDQIAFQFVWDYIDLIINTEATTTTYTNTLAKLGISKDLTGYEKYYQMVKKALTNEGFSFTTTADYAEIAVTANGKTAIDGLINLLGVSLGEYETYIGMIKEYKNGGSSLKATAQAVLKNTDHDYEALVLDLNASGVQNKFDYTNNLPARVSSIANNAAIMLLDDVDGDLVFNGTTILDLNGKTVNGNIVANGTLYIVDSALDTYNCGEVTGSVTGSATIFGGKYGSDVSAYLKDGYKQADGVVQNALFTVESADGISACFVINTGVLSDESMEGYLPNVKAMAIEMAVDLVFNYYSCAALTAEGSEIYNVNFNDLIGLLESDSKVDDVIVKILDSVNVPGIGDFINTVMADLLDFAAIEEAIANDAPVVSYTFETAPWAVTVEHITDGDYITVGIGSNAKARETKQFTIGIRFAGGSKALEYAERLAGALADIVVKDGTYIRVDLEQPTYEDKTLSAEGSAEAAAEIDFTVDENYTTVIAVILGYGNADRRAAIAEAVNANDKDALKAVIDDMTVEEVFTALKAMNRATGFAAMAEAVGVTYNVAEAAELEEVFHLILCGSGKVLEKLDITGRSSKLGGLDKDGDGTYEFSTTISEKTADISRRGYTAIAKVTSVELSLTVHLFSDENCLWGDANHDGVVNAKDADLVLQYTVNKEIKGYFCTVRTDVNGDGEINAKDADLILQYTVNKIEKFPAEG